MGLAVKYTRTHTHCDTTTRTTAHLKAMIATPVAFGAAAVGLWWVSRQGRGSTGDAVARSTSVRGADLSAIIRRGESLPRGYVSVQGKVTGPGGSSSDNPDFTAVIFVKSRLQKLFDCVHPTVCRVSWVPVSEDIEQLPLIELHRNRVDMPQPTSHDTTAKTAGQGLNDAVLQQVVSGNSMGPYRGAQLGEHVELDASAITSLEQIYAPETALRVDTRTFTPANGAPDDRTVQGYMEYVARAGSVENVPQNHRRIVLGEMYTERSINLGDQLHAVGTVAPSPYTPNVAIVTPIIVGVHDRDTMAENMQHPLLRKAALASAVAAALSATVNAWV
eukprot:m.214672 g.214672  ORF g.214672 m.214672 type:complete len:333 (+) comp27292_c0_seq1:137-1135(+)